MALSGSLSTKKTSRNRYLILSWTATQSTTDNSSSIKWTLKGAGKGPTGYDLAGNFKVVIDGDTVYSSSTRIQLYEGTVVASGTKKVTHNPDGTRNVTMSAQGGIYEFAVNSTGSKTFTLDTIARGARITSAPNFNDEENPTISYSNPAGNSVSSLTACISLDGSTDDIAYREISKTGTSYTFNLTTAERNLLRENTTGSNSRPIKFYIRTVVGGQTFTVMMDKTFSVINCAPTLSPTAIDINSTTVALTGDNTKFIRYASNASVSTGAAARKQSIIVNQYVDCGGQTVDGASGIIQEVGSGTFKFSATDNRGNTTTQTLNRTILDYIKLTCDLDAPPPSTDGRMTFTVSGNYFNGNFGATTNTLTVQYRYKTNNGSYGSWTTISNITVSDNSYTGSVTLTGLNYKNTYTFEARAIDKLATRESNEETVTTSPIFDWSNEDFNLNVPLYMNNEPFITNDGNTTTITAPNTLSISGNGDAVYIRSNGESPRAEVSVSQDGTVRVEGDLVGNGALYINGELVDDYIVERGGTGVYYWTLWASGKGHYTRLVSSTYNAASKYGNLYYTDFNLTVGQEVPVLDNTLENVHVTIEKGNGLCFCMVADTNVNGRGIKFRFVSAQQITFANRQDFDILYEFDGRWK